MADRVTWTPTPTNFAEGTSPFSHYIAHLGTATSPNLPAGTRFFDFPEQPPGDYPISVDTVSLDGTVRTQSGQLYHVPTPVSIAVAMAVSAARVA